MQGSCLVHLKKGSSISPPTPQKVQCLRGPNSLPLLLEFSSTVSTFNNGVCNPTFLKENGFLKNVSMPRLQRKGKNKYAEEYLAI